MLNTVEPVTESIVSDVVVDVKGNETGVCVPVKYSVEENTFDGVDNPFMFVVVTDTNGEIMKVDVASYDETKTEYIYYIEGLTHELIGSVILFKWNGNSLYPIGATVNLK